MCVSWRSPPRRASGSAITTTRRRSTLLAIALAALAAPALAATAPDSGVRGRVTISPTCPAEPYPPDPSCAPRGYQTTIRIRRLPGKQLVKVVQTGERGRFSTRLAPGRYRLRPRGGDPYPACQAVDVTVEAHAFTQVQVACDSGIR
jgi:hypothetical protein